MIQIGAIHDEDDLIDLGVCDQGVLGFFGAAQLVAGQVHIQEQVIKVVLGFCAQSRAFDIVENACKVFVNKDAGFAAPFGDCAEQFGRFEEIA